MEPDTNYNCSFSLFQSPSKNTQPRRAATASSQSPISTSPSSSPSNHFISSSTPSATTGSSSATPSASSSQHPLAQPPITANQPVEPSPAPLPFLPLAPPQVNALRAALTRRRSSFPPVAASGSTSASNIYPWVMGGTPGSGAGFDWGTAFESFPGFGAELNPGNHGDGTGLTPGTVAWETLLNFDTDVKPSTNKIVSSKPVSAKSKSIPPPEQNNTAVPRAKSDPLHDENAFRSSSESSYYQPTAPTPTTLPPAAVTPARALQLGPDLAWRTALASVVAVDGVGEVTVARVLQEIWRRGGGELVTSQCLWSNIVIALSMPEVPDPAVRIPPPSAQSAMALQQLYNFSIRHWEPAIFTGLLGNYATTLSDTSNTSHTSNDNIANDFASNQIYGPSTPLREPDVSQWMNLTPSGWNTAALFGGNNESQKNINGAFPFPLNSDLGSEALFARRTSLAKTEVGDDNNIKGIDEILASMEEGKEDDERAMMVENMANQDKLLNQQSSLESSNAGGIPSQQNSTFQFPTPETDHTNSPPVRRSSKTANTLSPVSLASPYVTAGSLTSTLIGPSPTTATSSTFPSMSSDMPSSGKIASLKRRPTQLSMPPVEFIPPPPMCMFFNPSFENLTDGKAGIWRGDLEVKGRGGGKFPIIVVGEKDTEHLWQSHLWPKTLTYPLNQVPVESCTSTMIPVSHLAREGLVPITMGMVLCNEPPERLAPYVNMVQGLHAEGVGFHLPCETRLPIVFLPAKFHSSDPLLRLGIAFMGKAGYTHPPAPLSAAGQLVCAKSRTSKSGSIGQEEDGPKKKKRRQSAPPAVNDGRGRKRKENALTNVGKIDEEGE
ncbi:uncharacterized protein IL334_003420 [Kwoniella shivajii]|uniref:ARID domain-containing protein n=1 Tax=Kwoniella shivajii TaxID=564305 RepID=A0ABZ1CXH1_9TREE|nr:hypothetical protein IL334_003420 [Kwoniella shivajii]